jgi:hypothetical protein
MSKIFKIVDLFRSNLMISKEDFKTNTAEIEKKYLSNDDFVFFNISLKPKHEIHYGNDYFYIEADDIEFFKYEWLNYIDFLYGFHYLSKVTEKQVIGGDCMNIVRSIKPCKKIECYGGSLDTDYMISYPYTKEERNRSLTDLISYAEDMKESIALSIIIELRLIGLSNKIKFSYFDNEKKQKFCNNILNSTFYLEAKMPKKICVKFMRKDFTKKFKYEYLDNVDYVIQHSLNAWKKDLIIK